eukprot:scaffold124618_cov35-Attheya_sp.AAC.1
MPIAGADRDDEWDFVAFGRPVADVVLARFEPGGEFAVAWLLLVHLGEVTGEVHQGGRRGVWVYR